MHFAFLRPPKRSPSGSRFEECPNLGFTPDGRTDGLLRTACRSKFQEEDGPLGGGEGRKKRNGGRWVFDRRYVECASF